MTGDRSEVLVVYTDGAIGDKAAGAGAIVLNERGRVLRLANRTLPHMTSHEAEYAGLILGLELAAPFRFTQVEIRLDNEVVVYQMMGRFAVNSAILKRWHRQACAQATTLTNLSYRHIPRDSNRVADALAAEAAAGRAWSMDQPERMLAATLKERR